jgi:hypothetical protein
VHLDARDDVYGDAQGREPFYRLVRESDVVIENMSEGTARRLGVGYESTSSRPGAIRTCARGAPSSMSTASCSRRRVRAFRAPRRRNPFRRPR